MLKKTALFLHDGFPKAIAIVKVTSYVCTIPHRVKLSDVVEKAHPQAVVLATHSSDGEAAKMFPFKRTSLSFFSTKHFHSKGCFLRGNGFISPKMLRFPPAR